MSDLNFYVRDKIPLAFTLNVNGVPQTGLTVTVQVLNAANDGVLLALTNCVETIPGSCNYKYNWVHGLIDETDCLAQFFVGGTFCYSNYFTIGDDDQSISHVT
jgi:hypothetical protein